MDRDRYTTPPEIVDRVHTFWNTGPDLDPFWDPSGAMRARHCISIRPADAGRFAGYSVYAGDGFKVPWADYGLRVWCQPPYSRGNPKRALALCADHSVRGGEAIALVNTATGSTYWRDYVYPSARCIVFPRRIAFHFEGKPQRGNEYEQAIIYYGSDISGFLAAFGDMSPAWYLDNRAIKHWL